MLPTTKIRLLKYGGIAVAALCLLAFLIAAPWKPDHKTVTKDDEHHVAVASEQYSAYKSSTESDLKNVVTALNSALNERDRKIASLTESQKDINTKITRDTIRFQNGLDALAYAKGNSDGKQVIVVPGAPSNPASSGPIIIPGQQAQNTGVPVEVIHEIIQSLDKSHDTVKVDDTDHQKSDVRSDVKVDMMATAKTDGMAVDTMKSTMKVDDVKTTVVTTDPTATSTHTNDSEKEHTRRLGVGIIPFPDPAPFVSYDLAKLRLGFTKKWSIGDIGAGLYVAGTGTDNLRGGPQANFETKSHFFGMVGLPLFSKDGFGSHGSGLGGVEFGIGYKF